MGWCGLGVGLGVGLGCGLVWIGCWIGCRIGVWMGLGLGVGLGCGLWDCVGLGVFGIGCRIKNIVYSPKPVTSLTSSVIFSGYFPSDST